MNVVKDKCDLPLECLQQDLTAISHSHDLCERITIFVYLLLVARVCVDLWMIGLAREVGMKLSRASDGCGSKA